MAEGEAVIGERAQHDSRVHNVLLKAQQPHVQTLKPHQDGVLCNQETRSHSYDCHLRILGSDICFGLFSTDLWVQTDGTPWS